MTLLRWSSNMDDNIKMIIQHGWKYQDDHPTWMIISRWSSNMDDNTKMIIQHGWQYQDDHQTWMTISRWSSNMDDNIKMIIQHGWPYQDDHPTWMTISKVRHSYRQLLPWKHYTALVKYSKIRSFKCFSLVLGLQLRRM